jgi:hypothetical protein
LRSPTFALIRLDFGGEKSMVKSIWRISTGKHMRRLFTVACLCLSTLPGFAQATLSFAGRIPDVQLTGTPGLNYRLDYINVYGPTNAWVQLTTLTLTNSFQHYLDVSAIGQPPRLYRLLPAP